MISCCWRKPKEPETIYENPAFLSPIRHTSSHLDLTNVFEREVTLGESGDIPSPKAVYAIEATELYDPRKKV